MAVIDTCAVDPEFESLNWSFSDPASSESFYKGEIGLWRKVIIRSLCDFCTLSRAHENERKAAEYWLLHNQSHFRFVCELADVEPDSLRNVIRRCTANRKAMRDLREALRHL